MMVLWMSTAFAVDLTLGKGRAAVVELDFAPTQVAISKPGVVDVVPSPPFLIINGKTAGLAWLTLTHEGGERKWQVLVKSDGSTVASGLEGLVPAGETLTLKPDEGVLCTLDTSPRASMLLDGRRAQIEPFGPNRYFLQAKTEGVVDVVFEMGMEPPRIFTLTTTVEGGDAVPEGCLVPETSEVKLNGSVVLDAGVRVGSLLVGHPSRIEALRVEGEPTQIEVKANQLGITTVLVRPEDDKGSPYAQRIVVVP